MVLLLDPYVDAILALALAFLITQIIRAAVRPLGGIPGIGHLITGAADSMAQAITNVLGHIVGGIDRHVGASIGWVATQVDNLASAIKRPALVLLESATLLGAIVSAIHALKALVHSAGHIAGSILPRVKTLEKEYHGIEHRVKTLEKDIGKGIGNDVRVHIRALEREVHGIEKGVIPGLRAGIRTAEGEVTQLENFIKAIPGTRYLDWAAGIVTAALGIVGLDWIACRNRNNVNGKSGCALWDDIAGLLGLAIVTGLALDLPKLIEEAQAATPPIIEGVEKLAGLRS